MDKVRKPNISVCYTPSSEPYSIYLRIIFGSKRGEIAQELKKLVLLKVKFHNLYIFLPVFRVKEHDMGWECNTYWGLSNACKIVVDNPKGYLQF
jgi:hypothetical protein